MKYLVKTDSNLRGTEVNADSFYCAHPREYIFFKRETFTAPSGTILVGTEYAGAFSNVTEIIECP